MGKRILMAGCVAVCLLGSVAFAGIDEIKIIMTFGNDSSFDADGGDGSGQQTITGIDVGSVTITGTGAFRQPDADVSAMVTDMTNTSSDGVASAEFDAGTWSLILYAENDTYVPKGDIVLSIAGTVDWYNEYENGSNAPDGEGIILFNSGDVVLNEDYWGTEVSWGSTVAGKSGVKTSISNAVQPPNPDLRDYDHDWTSSNVTFTVYADSSAIPEPMTMLLLGLGSVALLRRKK